MSTEVRGIPDLREALAGIVPKLRKRALRNALAAGARVVRDSARQATPVLSSSSNAVQRGIRNPGTLRKAVNVRTSKTAAKRGDVGVFVNVKPAKKGQRGGKSPNDPFYWRFVEFGTKKARATPFLQVGARKLDEALRIFIAKIGPAIEKLNKPKAPAP